MDWKDELYERIKHKETIFNMTPERLRKQMLKNPYSKLWDKDLNKWNDEDIARLCALENGTIQAITPRKKVAQFNRVIRVADGKIYNSITDCIADNNSYKVKMYNLINEGIHYKRL